MDYVPQVFSLARPASEGVGLCSTTGVVSPRFSDALRDPALNTLGFFLPGAGGYTVQNPVLVATWWLHGTKKQRQRKKRTTDLVAYFPYLALFFNGGT